MCKRWEEKLNVGIKKLETKDMIRRKIKVEKNEDRLFDFLKCQEIRKWREQFKHFVNELDSDDQDQKSDQVDESENGEKQMQAEVDKLSQQI